MSRTTTSPETPVARMISRKGVVTHGQALGAILGALALLAGSIAWTLREAEKPASAVRAQLWEHVEVHRGEVKDLKQEMRDGRNDLRLYLRLRSPTLPPELTQPLPEVP